MKFISAKCPNCGAELQVAENLKSGFCNHCGSKILFEPEVSNVKIDKSKSLGNYRELALSAVRSSDHKNELKYAEKALEIDPYDSEMWRVKVIALIGLSSWSDPKTQLIIGAGRDAIHHAKDKNDMMSSIYSLFIDAAQDHLDKAKEYEDDFFAGSSENFEKLDRITDRLKDSAMSLIHAAEVEKVPDDKDLFDKKKEFAQDWLKGQMAEHAYEFDWDDEKDSIRDTFYNMTPLSMEEAEKAWCHELDKREENLRVKQEAEKKKKAKENPDSCLGCLIAIVTVLIIYFITK